jgi:hypothetical protein
MFQHTANRANHNQQELEVWRMTRVIAILSFDVLEDHAQSRCSQVPSPGRRFETNKRKAHLAAFVLHLFAKAR